MCVLCCSEFIGQVGHIDECWHLLVHLPGLYQHEKQPAAAKTKAGQHTVTQPGNMSTLESHLHTQTNALLNYFNLMAIPVFQRLHWLMTKPSVSTCLAWSRQQRIEKRKTFRFGLTYWKELRWHKLKCGELLAKFYLVFHLRVRRYLTWPTAVTSHLWAGQEKVLIVPVFLAYLVLLELLGSQVK